MIIHNLSDAREHLAPEHPDNPPTTLLRNLPKTPNTTPLLTKKHKCDTLDTNASGAANSFLVTDIKPSLHNDSRVNVFINGAYDFSLEISQVIDLKVKIGKSFTKKELDSLKNESEFGKLYTTTLEWLLTRPHSEKEIRDHLKLRQVKRRMSNKHADKILPDITDESIRRVLIRLKEKGYIDDYQFAKFFVENRFVKKGISFTRLRQELVKKGIEKSIIDEVLRDSDRDDLSEINKIIDKKSKKYNKLQLKNYLIRQGFPSSRIDEAFAIHSDLN